MIWSEKHKLGAAEAVITTRDFCGDEREAIRQYATDNGLRVSTAQMGSILWLANKIWRTYQKRAGVDPKYYK